MKLKILSVVLIAVSAFSTLLFQNCNKEDEPNKAPSCEITNPSEGEEYKQDEIVSITVNANDSDGNISEVRFFIDGVDKATVNSLPYNYNWNTSGESIGTHTIKATSIDNGGASTSDEITIKLIKGEGSAFTANPVRGNAPLEVTFADQSTNNPISWNWDFGDGGSSTEQNPVHTYQNMGQYDVTLTTKNQDGSDSETKTNLIMVKGTYTDSRDNQTYSIVTIGDQIWFAENLNYKTDDSWWYMDDESNGDVYGRLYNWNAAMSACPNGWYLASDKDWKTLEMFLGMDQGDADGTEFRGSDEGKKLKSTSGWNAGGNGTDEVGFTALPGGERDRNGFFLYKGGFGAWWTNTEDFNQNLIAWSHFLEDGEERVGRDRNNKDYGYYVRCIKSD